MKVIEIRSTVFPDVKVINYERFFDSRGFFSETFKKTDFANFNLPRFDSAKFEVVQSNLSYSLKNVIRGLHFRWSPNQSKLIRVIEGEIIDLFLDIRKNSPTFGKISAVKLTANIDEKSESMIWIPFGFAHGFATTKNSYVEYYCDAEYSPTTEAGISPLSTDIDWSLCDVQLKNEFNLITQNGVVSDKDKAGLTVGQWKSDLRSEKFI